MAGDWIKLRTGLLTSLAFMRVCEHVEKPPHEVLVKLYVLAAWFRTHGTYGRIQGDYHLVDAFTGVAGLASALMAEDWLRFENGFLILRGFTDVSALRKSLGRRVRRQVLSAGKCAACGATGDLVIDHSTPISRGGTSEMENLQALCQSCNARKGKRTMEEFLRDR